MRRSRAIDLAALVLALVLLCSCAVPDTGPAVEPLAAPTVRPAPTAPTQAPSEQPSDAPTQPPTETETEPSAEALLEQRVQTTLDAMTTEEKVAQLFIVTPEALLPAGAGTVTAVDADWAAAYQAYPVGGVLLMGANLDTWDQTQAMLGDMQRIGTERLGFPVFLCVDEEGGTVARISGRAGFGIEPWPDMAAVGAAGDTQQAFETGLSMGGYLSALGFNLDFAPVADVYLNEENTVVRRRSFGSDPLLVTRMCAAFSDGLRERGVLPCYKHFPGHGATSEDSHNGFASSPRTLDALRACELLPFLDAAQRGVPLIMSGHITLPNVTDDGLPASLSYPLLTELLRGELGYTGLIVTDALNMGAIAQYYSPGEAAVMAVLAGNDLLLLGGDFSASYTAVLEAVQEGRIPMERLDESVCRILRAKYSWLTEEAGSRQ